MLSKTIEYPDFEGVKRTDTFYFNLMESELMELMVGYGEGQGLEKFLNSLKAKMDGVKLMQFAKDMLLMSYGEKSSDGRGFVKNHAIRDQFASTNAFSTLFMKMVTDENFLMDFLIGVIPSKFSNKAKEEIGGKTTAQLIAENAPKADIVAD